jgi:hypothetical protein
MCKLSTHVLSIGALPSRGVLRLRRQNETPSLKLSGYLISPAPSEKLWAKPRHPEGLIGSNALASLSALMSGASLPTAEGQTIVLVPMCLVRQSTHTNG